MRPSARIAALIELLTEVEEGIAAGGAPADVIVNQYFRARRYAGSKDRRAVTEQLYAILRSREFLLWAAGTNKEPRGLVIAHLLFTNSDDLDLFEEEGPFAPNSLSAQELEFIDALKQVDAENTPLAIQKNVPDWAIEEFQSRFSDQFEQGADGLNTTAPVDLRPNSLKVDSSFINNFINEQEGFEKTRISPICVRSIKNIGLGGVAAYKRGDLEVQDEAAQVASLLVDAKPGMQVADLCAGAGGKALLVSAQMENKGQLYALDTSSKRLTECRKRLDRSGSRNIQIVQLTDDASHRTRKLDALSGKCDRVYLDVPCSGTGTWRRSPDQRWRFDLSKLKSLNETQYGLLAEGAKLVREDGKLLYMTCSVLPAENEAIVDRFMTEYGSEWSLCDYKALWAEAIPTTPPETYSKNTSVLQLVPHLHDTDGFFIAIFERKR